MRSKRPFRSALCSKNHIFTHCGRAARAKRLVSMTSSYESRGGFNEVSHARPHTRPPQRLTTKHLLLYRCYEKDHSLVKEKQQNSIHSVVVQGVNVF